MHGPEHSAQCVVFATVLGDRANRLKEGSQAYKSQASLLNLRASLAVKIAIVVVIFLFFILLRYLIF